MKINILVGTMTGTAQMCAQEMELARPAQSGCRSSAPNTNRRESHGRVNSTSIENPAADRRA
jgi:hypothetical protein